MRDRRQEPAPQRQDEFNPQLPEKPAFARRFAPESLDLDQLANAVQRLLQSGDEPKITGRKSRKSDLLLSPSRASHVLEATEAR